MDLEECLHKKKMFEVPSIPFKPNSSANTIQNKVPICIKQEAGTESFNNYQNNLIGLNTKEFIGNQKKTSDNGNLEIENKTIFVKLEENSDFPKIRKKMCRKMLTIFNEEFNIEKKDAKKLTQHLESRFNLQYSCKTEKYVNSIKKFFTNLRNKDFMVQDCSTVPKLQMNDFGKFICN